MNKWERRENRVFRALAAEIMKDIRNFCKKHRLQYTVAIGPCFNDRSGDKYGYLYPYLPSPMNERQTDQFYKFLEYVEWVNNNKFVMGFLRDYTPPGFKGRT